MNLNMDIIFERLSETMEVTRFGVNTKDLLLRHVSFYVAEKPLRKDCVYITRASELAEQPIRCRGIHFICVGGRAPQALIRGTNSFLVLEDQSDILEVFTVVQDAFLYYEAWEDTLQEIVRTTADIGEMITQSVPVFNNPLLLIDRDLRLLVQTTVITDELGRQKLQVSTPNIPVVPERILEFKEILLSGRQRIEPFFLPKRNYNINLFLHNTYVGVIVLQNDISDPTQSDFALFGHLANLVLKAMRKRSTARSIHITTLKSALEDLLDNYPVKATKLNQVLGSDKAELFFCFKIRPNRDNYDLPTEYLCDELESLIPGCIALEHESLIVCYVRLSASSYAHQEILSILWEFLHSMDFRAGVSNTFTDIINARYYFRQACCAIETGRDIHPNKRCYLFSDYVVPYMLLNCPGDLPVRFICPKSLLQLRSQSKNSSVDYWETLKVYLDSGMNATETARKLYLHRSTLLQRLSKINSVLDMDLHNPLQRMYIHSCIYMLDMKNAPEKLFKNFASDPPHASVRIPLNL